MLVAPAAVGLVAAAAAAAAAASLTEERVTLEDMRIKLSSEYSVESVQMSEGRRIERAGSGWRKAAALEVQKRQMQ